MHLYVDSAEARTIQRALASGFVWGVTTNPTLLRRAGVRRSDLPALVNLAGSAGAREIHLQVFADDVGGMMADARDLVALDPSRVVVKILATAAGIAAAARLSAEGVPVTLTAICSVRQIVLADMVGARYAAVYLGRLREAGQDAFDTVREILEAIRAQQMSLRLLVASIRDAGAVEALARMGVAAATLPPDILFTLPESEGTGEAARMFREDAAYV